LEERHLGAEIRPRAVDPEDLEASPAFRDDVVSTVLQAPRGDDRSLRPDPSREGQIADFLALQNQRDPEGLLVSEAAADHLAVAGLEDVEGQRRLREEDGMEREEGQPHGPDIPRGTISLRHFGWMSSRMTQMVRHPGQWTSRVVASPSSANLNVKNKGLLHFGQLKFRPPTVIRLPRTAGPS